MSFKRRFILFLALVIVIVVFPDHTHFLMGTEVMRIYSQNDSDYRGDYIPSKTDLFSTDLA